MKEVKKCEECQKYFVSYRTNSICCSKECSYKRRLRLMAESREEIKPKKPRMKKSNMKSIADISVEARKAGMTYGQYVAKMGL